MIIVDDGSSDSTVNICNEIINKKENATIILNKHHGLSNSRNTGIKKASGKYIVFVDGDDCNKYTRYVIFRCIRNCYGNYNKFSNSEKLLLDSWYIKRKIVFVYGIKYSLLLMLYYLLFGYKKGISLYKSHFKAINKRCDVINDIPKSNIKNILK